MYGRRMNRAFASDALILQLNKSKNNIVEPEYQKVLRRVEFPVHWGQQKFPVRVGVSILLSLSVTLLNEAYMT